MHLNLSMYYIVSKYSMPFCLISEIIQRREAKLNIILLRVNDFNIKQKKAWNICFTISHQHQTRSGKIKTNTANFGQNTSFFELNYVIFNYNSW